MARHRILRGAVRDEVRRTILREAEAGRSWVYNQIKSGEMPSIQLGGSVKVKREDLEEYIQNHRR